MRKKAIFTIHPDVFTINAGIDARDKDGNVVVLDESRITIEVARLQAVYDAHAYARLRKTEYDKLNQNEMMYDDEVNSTTTWKDAIVAIKAKYPKPE
jgi:hypothetical protein